MGGIDFQAVAAALSCRTFAEAEGLPLRGGRAQCPFHGGHNFNLAFYGDHCHCFKCCKTADVVQLAAQVWNVPQLEAALELNSRYALGLVDAPVTLPQRATKGV